MAKEDGRHEMRGKIIENKIKVNMPTFDTATEGPLAEAGETTPGLDKSTGKSYLPLPHRGSRVGYPARGKSSASCTDILFGRN